MDKAEYNAHLRKMRAMTPEEYETNPAYCLHCGKKIEYEDRINRCCDSSCAASYRNKGVRRHPPADTRYCECGVPIVKPINKWCDACIEKHVYNKKTVYSALEALKSDRGRRMWLINVRGHRCEICGLAEWQGQPITLELDHIDGNSDNNTAGNLRIICPNCHSQTPFWKGSVKGKEGSRQKNRRKRYANGQTW
ncbi:MAG: HNH endonuclease signature motif containing protein [Anaerolineae bacterium]